MPLAPVSLRETPQANTLGNRKPNKKSKCLPGFIFLCNGRTKAQCYRYRVFGLPAGRLDDVQKVKKGMKLFLFDVDVKLLYGIYKATSNGQMNLEPSAFGGNFPAQVRFAIYKECLPLHEAAFKSAIRENYEGSKFKAELTRWQVKNLLPLFQALTAASVAPIPWGGPSQANWSRGLADQFQPSVVQPPSQGPYLAGGQRGYAAPAVEPYSVKRVLNDPYSRYSGLQQMAPSHQFANTAGGCYNYPTTATSYGPQPTHPSHVGYTPYPNPATSQHPPVMHHLQHPPCPTPYPIPSQGPPVMTPYPIPATSQGPPVMTLYPIPATSQGPPVMTPYPIPATSQGPPVMHHPHGGREFDSQREDVAKSCTPYPTPYPIPATSQGPPVMHHLHGGREFDPQRADVARSYTPYPIPAGSQGPPPMYPFEQLPGMLVQSFHVSSNYVFDGAQQMYR